MIKAFCVLAAKFYSALQKKDVVLVHATRRPPMGTCLPQSYVVLSSITPNGTKRPFLRQLLIQKHAKMKSSCGVHALAAQSGQFCACRILPLTRW